MLTPPTDFGEQVVMGSDRWREDVNAFDWGAFWLVIVPLVAALIGWVLGAVA